MGKRIKHVFLNIDIFQTHALYPFNENKVYITNTCFLYICRPPRENLRNLTIIFRLHPIGCCNSWIEIKKNLGWLIAELLQSKYILPYFAFLQVYSIRSYVFHINFLLITDFHLVAHMLNQHSLQSRQTSVGCQV